MLDIHIDPSATYLVACTYGPDSMALLDKLEKEKLNLIVCCINYHVFASSDEDAKALKQYCESHSLKFEYFDCESLPDSARYKPGSDFRTWARLTRYSFFQNVYVKYGASGLFVAHHQDDIIESYLMEKEGKTKAGNYSLSPMQESSGMIVIRPLLHFTHQDLLEYNEENHVPFSNNSETFESEYTRDAIRKQIANMNEVEREQILEEMNAKKANLIRLNKELTQQIDEGEELEIRALIALPSDVFFSVLNHFVSRANVSIALKPEDVDKIRKFMLSPKPNASYHLKGDAYLIKEYDIVLLGHKPDQLPYTYTLDAPGKLSTDQFELDFTGGAEDRGIKAEDYPLTIRSALPADSYVVHGYLQNIRQTFSMWKMPIAVRDIWPVFFNKDGKVVYVPRYSMNFREYHTSKLVVHMPEGTK